MKKLPTNDCPKRQGTAALQDASRISEPLEGAPAFGVRQSSAAFSGDSQACQSPSEASKPYASITAEEKSWASLREGRILHWLREEDPKRLQKLWHAADEARHREVGDAVHLRGLVEISSFCARQCAYCGLRADNRQLERYRMSAEEILTAAREAVTLGYGTVVLQAGEDYRIKTAWLSEIIRRIKTKTPLAVTLSLGERSFTELATWRAAGADRYLLRFETSDRALFNAIHPGLNGVPCDRIAILRQLKQLGYETGSGIMVGLPGQTYASIARDIMLFRELDLDMIGIGPYIPHPATPLARGETAVPPIDHDQTPNSELMVYKAIALTRLICPQANIPSTTALATINRINGRELALQRGANVVMPNLTPVKYRRSYEIYPAKACIDETAQQCSGCLGNRITRIGRAVGRGPGGRISQKTYDTN
jgi:biotin synthase